MIKWLLEKIARRMYPNYSVDERVTNQMIFSYGFSMGVWWLRSWLLILRGRFPRMLFLGPGVSLLHLRNIKLGKFVRVHERAHLSGLGNGKLEIGDYVRIGAFSRIAISETYNDIGEFIKIGNRVGISDFAHLGGAGGLEIGDDTIIGSYFSCHPESHIFSDTKQPIRLQGVERKGIVVGKNCWIGAKVTILDGVTVGENSVIAAGAVVTKSFPARSIIGGVPAKVIREI